MKYLIFVFIVTISSCRQNCEELTVKRSIIRDSIFSRADNISSSKDHIVVVSNFRKTCNSKLDIVLLVSKYIDSIELKTPLNSITFISETKFEDIHGELDSLSLTKEALITFYYSPDSSNSKGRKFRYIISWDKDAMK